LNKQETLFPEEFPEGNTLKKAYLSNSPIASIPNGSILAFYLSGSKKSVAAIGVVEKTIRSRDPVEIYKFSRSRTVFPMAEIRKLCEKEVIGIHFRYCPIIHRPIPVGKIPNTKFAAPQSIGLIPKEIQQWLQTNLKTS